MSQLAQSLATATIPTGIRKGPQAACHVYGAGDLEDWQALMALKAQGLTWAQLQTMVDEQVGVERRIKLDQFRYHWNRKCDHWPHGE